MFDWLKRSPQTEHEFCQENLSPFLDSQLAPREQTRVTRHLKECADCRADLQSLRQTVAVLQAVPMVKPPRTFFIPVSEGVRQRQVQRSRLAYGYLQFATAVATVLLVLVVSGDALLRLGVGGPARQGMAPSVEITAVSKEEDVSEELPVSAPVSLTAAPGPQGLGAAPPPAAEPTAAPVLAQPALPTGASPTEAAATTADSQALTAEAVPSQTFARSAGAPPLPTATGTDEATASPVAEGGQPEVTATPQFGVTGVPEAPTLVPAETSVPPTATPLPTETPVPPTATPLPTQTPVPPTATPVPPAEQPSPQPAPVELQRQAPPSAPAGRLGFLKSVQPLLPWLEWALGVVLAVLLVAMLWLRRRQRTA